ncbi:MAG: endonuclease domain-containing protein [Chloroflexota bacterium]|nr:endonuclease domain-containing protein [Chloroflexota bacterium]
MSLPRNKKLTNTSQSLRRNMTKEERHLWYDFLRNYPVQFNRQKVIGSYIVDFYCHKAKLIVELDGSQHYQDVGLEYDKRRTEYLNSLGLYVLRIPNNEIWGSFPSVCETIDQAVKERLIPHQSACS